jgi:hypothetical protein
VDQQEARDKNDGRPYPIRLPGFVSDEDVGLGEFVKRATYVLGITPCGNCERRAAALNRWVVFSSRRSR